jgi:hypothetical protein
MAIGDEELVEFVNWDDLYNHTDTDEAPVIDGLAYRGRWTAIASPAKAGKSTVILALAIQTAQTGQDVIYVDAEMGRGDVLERVEDWMNLKPDDLAHLHYTDLPPKLDVVQGAMALYHTCERIHPALVIIDGLNGVVNGAENDDTTWRDMFELAIAPLKQNGIAIITADNTGHGDKTRPRGSSVKLDKADAIVAMERTDTGVKFTCTHRRTSAYPKEQEYTVTDASESGPPMAVTRIGGQAAPEGTNRINGILDRLGAPWDISRRAARKLLVEHEGQAPRNDVLDAMLKWRRQQADPFHTQPVDNFTNVVPIGPRDQRDQGLKLVPEVGDHSQETPASGVVPDGVSTCSTPPARPRDQLAPEADDLEPF